MTRPWEIFESLAERYDRWFDGKGRVTFQSELSAIKLLAPVIEHPSLEVGVGTGRFASALGVEFGLDPSRQMLLKAATRGVKVTLGRGEFLPFRSGFFRTVVMVTTLEFVSNARTVLQEVFRVLRVRGRIIVGFIPADSPWGLYYRRRAAEGDAFYANSSFLIRGELLDLIRSAGFSVERSVSTLCQKPGQVTHVEAARGGLDPNAGFVAILAIKRWQDPWP